MTSRYGQEAKAWTVSQIRARAEGLTDVAVVNLACQVAQHIPDHMTQPLSIRVYSQYVTLHYLQGDYSYRITCSHEGALYEVSVEAEGSDIPADILSAMTGGI